jgi:hypothetical protein
MYESAHGVHLIADCLLSIGATLMPMAIFKPSNSNWPSWMGSQESQSSFSEKYH